MSVELKRYSAGIQVFLRGPEIGAAMVAAARGLRDQAQRTAPKGKSGRLAASYKVEAAEAAVKTRQGGTHTRAVGRVYNDAPHALAVEFGHRARDGTTVPGAHTLGLLAGMKRRAQ